MLLTGEDFEDNSRNAAAECVGQLALLYPDLMFPSLQSKLQSPSENVRCLVIAGIRYAIVDAPHPVDLSLKGSLGRYLECLRDSSRHVRKATVQLLSSAIAHKFRLVQEVLRNVLPDLYEQTVKKEDLIRVLDFGPFKHKIDDGIELRKATFECMDLLLDVALPHLEVREFLHHLLKGLSDVDDIKLLCYPMLMKLCLLTPNEVLQEIDRLVEPLQKTLMGHVPKESVKHEVGIAVLGLLEGFV